MEIGNWYVNPELDSGEIERRTQAAQEWVNGIYEVVEKTKDTEAQRLLNGVLGGIAVGLPDPEQYLVPVQGPEQPTIFIVPLFTSDTDASEVTKMMMNPNSSLAAYYTENKPGRIYFNSEVEMSPLLRGLLMLHEAKHAEIFESNQFSKRHELDHWLEEVATFEFEFKLLQKLCGKSYEELIDESVARFIEEYGDKDGQGGTLPRPGSIDIAAVDEVFGPSRSERERTLRKSLVWMDMVFQIFEQADPDTAQMNKAKFVRQIYGY